MIQQTITEGMDSVENFKCIHCEQYLPITDMSTDSHHTVRYECKTCRKENAAIVRKLKKENLGTLPSMEDKCPTCKRTGQQIRDRGSFQKRKPWTLDHCHKTGKLRGWICQHCNNTLSGAHDSKRTLKNLIEYLEKHEDIHN